MKKLRVFFLIPILAASGILLAAADFGESSASLGQITDEFDTLDNISVRVLIERNATLNAMELNFTARIFPYENFSLWTETDPQNKIAPVDYNVSWVNFERNDGGRVVKDFGINAIQNFDFHFEFKISDLLSTTATGRTILIVFTVDQADSVGLGTHYSLIQVVEDGASDTTYVWWMTSRDAPAGSNSQQGTVKMDVGTIYYVRYFQTGGNKTLLVYSDPGETILLQKLTHIIGNDAYRYAQVVKIVTSGTDPNDFTSGYMNELYNGSGLAGYSNGYFTTTDQLASINGSVLVQLTTATIPAGTGITVEFSPDNSTWVNNLNGSGSNTLTDGLNAFDLRPLNWSAAHYVRYNLSSSDPTVTPRLNQSRLITTQGPAGAAGPGAPGLNVSRETVTYNLTEIGVTVGTLDAGDLNSTRDIDGDLYNVSELVGAPGMQISGNFSGVDPDAGCLWVVIYAHYDGNLNHDFDIEVWNFTSSAWVEDSHITDGTELEWFNSTIYALRIPNEFLSGGEVRVRLDHEAPGNINHDLFIEYWKLLAEIPAGPTPGAGAVVNIIESDFPWIAIAIILMCVAYLLLRPK